MASTSPPVDTSDLQARVNELEVENKRLLQESAVSASGGTAGPPVRGKGAQRWRAPLSALCIVIAAVLVPVSIVASWTRVELVDQDAFVRTFAPLADDPDVQSMIIDQTMLAIGDAIDLEAITDDVFDGIVSLGLPPAATTALGLLRGPAAAGVQSILNNAVTTAVESDAFSAVWERALRLSHTALLTAVNRDGEGALNISDTGEVSISLGPIVTEVRERLIAQGFGLAQIIPPVDRTIVVAQSDALVTVSTVYTLAVIVGWWLPLVSVGLFILGIALARRRATALLGSGIGLALGSAALAIALATVGALLEMNASRSGVSSAALGAIYAQVIAAMRDTAIVLTLLGALLALISWLSGGSRTGRNVQRVLGSLNAGARAGLAERGVDTGPFGAWLYRQRILVRVVITTAAVVWLFALRPLTPGDVFLVLIVGLVVWWLTELAQRRPTGVEVGSGVGAGSGVEAEAEVGSGV